MGVTLSNPDSSILSGSALWENCEGSGQLSIYNSLQLDIAPFLATYRAANPTRFRYAAVKGYMLTEVTAYNPLTLSKFEGYPSRYNLGGWRYLQANRALDKPRYIDTFQWADNQNMKTWVSETGFPDVAFPGAAFPVPNFYSVISPLIASPGSDTANSLVAADGFSFFLTEGVEMTFAFLWYCTVLDWELSAVPEGVYLLNI